MSESCNLCGSDDPLQNSHIIPKFVFRWQKQTSPTGHLRSGETINRRQQDGFTQKMLCQTCEGKFSIAESKFKNSIFDNAVSKRVSSFSYGPWLSYFAVSIVWRATQMHQIEDTTGPLDEQARRQLIGARNHWKAILSGAKRGFGRYPVHIFEQWQLHDAKDPQIPGIWNRYLNRHSVIRLINSNAPKLFTVYVKMGPLSIFGHIDKPKHSWHGTRLNTSGGRYHSKKVSLPEDVFRLYLIEANEHKNLINGASSKQKEVITKSILGNLNDAMSTDGMRAFEADFRISGNAAFMDSN